MSVASSTSFLELLRRFRLLEPAQLEVAERTLVPRLAEAKALGGELLKRGWLTAFQVNQLLQGRAQDLVLGSYVLLERLGEGGMGAVYKARHAKLGRTVAVKVIRKERLGKGDAVRRFQREIRAAAQLNHPNIVRAYDADEVDGTHLLAMELVEGAVDLAKLVKDRGPLPVTDACEYIRQAALGLQHAFERGMVHRDIKPQNLLIANCGMRNAESKTSNQSAVIKILDMGLARLGDDDKGENSTSTLTQEGAVMGTLDYIAPEQARDSHTVDIRADLYSLGCTMFFLLTGRVPFPGGTAAQKLMKHQLDAPPWVSSLRPEVPEHVSHIVAKLMAKRQEDRFRTPAELASALANPSVMVATGTPLVAAGRGNVTPTRNAFADLGAGDTVVAESTPAPEPVKVPPRPVPWKWLALGGGGVAGLMILLLMLLNGGPGKSTPDQRGEVTQPKDKKGSVIEPTVVADPDRRAAEWVLSIGGGIRIREGQEERDIGRIADLPKGPFALTVAFLSERQRVTDDGLASLQGCKELKIVNLALTPLTNAGLAHLKDCKKLEILDLQSTAVTDAGLAYMKECSNLRELNLAGCKQVGDDGLAHFEGHKNLAIVSLYDTLVTNAGLIHLKDCANLKSLAVTSTKVSEAGLAHLKECKKLTTINVQNSAVGVGVMPLLKDWPNLTHAHLVNVFVSDMDLVHLKDSGNLSSLFLASQNLTDAGLVNLKASLRLTDLLLASDMITDAGLEHLKGLVNLQFLLVKETKVTADGAKKLATALPHCKIEWAGGVIEPQTPLRYTNALGMEFVLVPKGKSWLGGGGGKVGDKEVEIKQDFYLGKYEVTQEEWEKIMGNNPSHFSRTGKRNEVVKDVPDADLKRFPVEWVSWNEAEQFIKRVNDNVKDAGWVYRLPKLVEWEYACRGGPLSDKADSGFDYYFAKPTNDYQVLKSLANYNGLNRTCKVGSYPPNRLGLHDMHGNVWEWCADELPPDAKGFPQRAFRGGGAHGLMDRCRAASHILIAGSERDYDVGLRLARVPVSKDSR